MPEETAFALTEEAGILTLTMSAPGNNLMTGAFFREYEAIMDQVQLRSTQPGIRGLIIRGGGRHFSVGADVDALAERSAAESFDGKRLPPAHCKQKRHFYLPAQSALPGGQRGDRILHRLRQRDRCQQSLPDL